MHLPYTLLLYSLTVLCAKQPIPRTYNSHDYYVLEHDPTHGLTPQDCASALGLELVQELGELRDHWILRSAKGQPNYAHIKRKDTSKLDRSIKGLELQRPRTLHKRDRYPESRSPLPPLLSSSSQAVAARLDIADPLFAEQWHLVNDKSPQHSLNAIPVWEMGITGTGVTVAMVDDGVDYESIDLADNFDADGSYDFNLHTLLPKPLLKEDTHGTRCAGQIAAVKNKACGIGIAYTSKIAGLRILSGPVTSIDEATALNYRYNATSIYSCSWGPHDDAMTLDGPSNLIQKALLNGVTNGRNGKGSVFVFASGNGGGAGDMCGFDGYTNSIWSVTIGSINDGGWAPLYSEGCAAMMAVTYSSGSRRHRDIVTTDVGRNECTNEHGGTSAAAPFASAIVALALSARPDLSWRDIQHLVVRTAVIIDPEDPSWEPTASMSGVGKRFYSHQYGWGKLDAEKYVSASLQWNNVKPQAWVRSGLIQFFGASYAPQDGMKGGMPISAEGVNSSFVLTTQHLQKHNFDQGGLEHVIVRVWISHEKRGDVEVRLISPNGVVSILGGRRKRDWSTDGFEGWSFMSVKHWSENPIGAWLILVSDQNEGSSGHTEGSKRGGRFLAWSMTFFGSCIDASQAAPFSLERDMDLEEGGWIGNDTSESATEVHGTESFPTRTKVLPKPSLPPLYGTEPEKPTLHPSHTSSSDSPNVFVPILDTFRSLHQWLFLTLSVLILVGIGFLLSALTKKNDQMIMYHNIDVPLVERELSYRDSLTGSNSRPDTIVDIDHLGPQ